MEDDWATINWGKVNYMISIGLKPWYRGQSAPSTPASRWLLAPHYLAEQVVCFQGLTCALILDCCSMHAVLPCCASPLSANLVAVDVLSVPSRLTTACFDVCSGGCGDIPPDDKYTCAQQVNICRWA